jgi:hypothetical protein
MNRYECIHVWLRDSDRDAIHCSCGATMTGEQIKAGDPAFLRKLREEFARRDREYDDRQTQMLRGEYRLVNG